MVQAARRKPPLASESLGPRCTEGRPTFGFAFWIAQGDIPAELLQRGREWVMIGRDHPCFALASASYLFARHLTTHIT